MDEAWRILTEAGLPDGALRPAPVTLDAQRLRGALEEVTSGLDQLETRQLELLQAWLKGWRHHWPRRFTEILGRAGDRCYHQVAHAAVDANRYLKLRRIAIENLAQVL